MPDKAPIYQDPTQPIEARVADLLSRMTLEEKTSQMLHTSPAIPRLGIPEYNWWSEALHGVARNGRATVFPQCIGLAATFDVPAIERMAVAISDEGRAKHHEAARRGKRGPCQGLTFWSPNVNIFRDPRWGRGQETYGEDPCLTGELAAAFVRGMQGSDPRRMKAATCAKHYAVHSGPESERHTFDARVSLKDLRETYLPAFERLVHEGVEAVMGAYNRTNGEPCCASKLLMEDILRGEWGFQGHYVSDCGAVDDFHQGHLVTKSAPESAALAVKMGCDVNCGNTYVALGEAVKQGLVTEADIDRCLARLLRTKFRLGLLDPEGSGPYENIPTSVVDSEAHRRMAREMGVKTMVLLKNDGVLPLRSGLSKIMVTGPHAASIVALLGNYHGLNPRLVTILEGISGRAPEGTIVEYRMGRDPDRDKLNALDWALGECSNADVVVAVLGLDPLMEGEEGEAIRSDYAGDRRDIELPRHQVDFFLDLCATGKPVVVVLTGGAAMAVPEIQEKAAAVLMAWYPGEEGGNAVADVLFGDAAPTGKLPVTFPKATRDLPPFEEYAMAGRTYRYMEKEPLYPFGFGLGYTKFAYAGLKMAKDRLHAGETLKVEVEVRNEGARDGEEIVQVYLRDLEASVAAPLAQLVAFRRVAVQAGAKAKVAFEIPASQMEIVGEDGKRRLEPGRFRVWVGGASPGARSEALGAPAPATAEFEVA